MKKYTKPTLEVVEVAVKENIAADIAPGIKTYDDGQSGAVVTEYTLNTYAGDALASV